MTIFEELQRRGLIAQMTNPEGIEKALNEGRVTFYIGFDATADSLHVGHLLQIIEQCWGFFRYTLDSMIY